MCNLKNTSVINTCSICAHQVLTTVSTDSNASGSDAIFWQSCIVLTLRSFTPSHLASLSKKDELVIAPVNTIVKY